MDNFKRSSFCGNQACVDVDLVSHPDLIQVRDQYGNQTVFDHDEWQAFVKGVKAGEFDV